MQPQRYLLIWTSIVILEYLLFATLRSWRFNVQIFSILCYPFNQLNSWMLHKALEKTPVVKLWWKYFSISYQWIWAHDLRNMALVALTFNFLFYPNNLLNRFGLKGMFVICQLCPRYFLTSSIEPSYLSGLPFSQFSKSCYKHSLVYLNSGGSGSVG